MNLYLRTWLRSDSSVSLTLSARRPVSAASARPSSHWCRSSTTLSSRSAPQRPL